MSDVDRDSAWSEGLVRIMLKQDDNDEFNHLSGSAHLLEHLICQGNAVQESRQIWEGGTSDAGISLWIPSVSPEERKRFVDIVNERLTLACKGRALYREIPRVQTEVGSLTYTDGFHEWVQIVQKERPRGWGACLAAHTTSSEINMRNFRRFACEFVERAAIEPYLRSITPSAEWEVVAESECRVQIPDAAHSQVFRTRSSVWVALNPGEACGMSRVLETCAVAIAQEQDVRGALQLYRPAVTHPLERKELDAMVIGLPGYLRDASVSAYLVDLSSRVGSYSAPEGSRSKAGHRSALTSALGSLFQERLDTFSRTWETARFALADQIASVARILS